jgi:hypothetical protein
MSSAVHEISDKMATLCEPCTSNLESSHFMYKNSSILDDEGWIQVYDFVTSREILDTSVLQGCMHCGSYNAKGEGNMNFSHARWSVHPVSTQTLIEGSSIDFDELKLELGDFGRDDGDTFVSTHFQSFDIRAEPGMFVKLHVRYPRYSRLSSGSFSTKLFSAPEFSSDFLTDENMRIALSWINKCSTSHKLCHRRLNKEELPTRSLR